MSTAKRTDTKNKSVSESTIVDESPMKANDQASWERNTEAYLENCRKYGLIVDPSVVIALKTGWEIMQPTKQFGEGGLLPLMGILEKNDHIKKLRLQSSAMSNPKYRAAGNGNTNARALREILSNNSKIELLDLSDTGLDDDGIMEICEGIKNNNSITQVNLSSNHFGEMGAEKLRQALEVNSSIKKLDLSRNALGFRSISNLLCSCKPKGMDVDTRGNFVFEEILNSVSHGFAFIVSIVGANVLISDAADAKFTDYHFWACVLYSFALMFLFLSSCLFHSFFMSPHVSRILQILDHIGIYLVIAGSYTPILMIGLHHDNHARVLLMAEWIAAFFGIVFASCSDLNAITSTIFELTIFLLMGSGIFLIWSTLVASLPYLAIVLLMLGAAAYLIGIIFFILGEYHPVYHCIWHLFVIMGAAFHWFDVYLFIVRTELGAAANAQGVDMMGKLEDQYFNFHM